MNPSRFLGWGVGVALVAAFVVGVSVGVSQKLDNTADAAGFTIPGTSITLGGGLSSAQPKGVDAAKFWQAWNLLQQNFIQTHGSGTIPTPEERIYGAIAGLTDSYGDPYTVFLPPKEAKQFNEEIKGVFGGVGMELGTRDGVLTVVAPLKDSPAERAGVRAGDVVVAVDGRPTEKMAVDKAVGIIRGEVGTTVSLVLRRAKVAEPISLKIVRDTIKIPVIKGTLRGDGVYVLELYSFTENSDELFRQELRKFKESGSAKLVLDLRGNPGGYLEAAVQMASYFLPVGNLVVTEDYGGKEPNSAHRSLGYNVFAGKPIQMVILIDQGSASASEILSGALRDHGVAKLVGTRSFGKGSVQQLVELGGGAELKITVAKWLTPSGISISDGGLKPDVAVERTPEDVKAGKDPQLDAAIALLLKK